MVGWSASNPLDDPTQPTFVAWQTRTPQVPDGLPAGETMRRHWQSKPLAFTRRRPRLTVVSASYVSDAECSSANGVNAQHRGAFGLSLKPRSRWMGAIRCRSGWLTPWPTSHSLIWFAPTSRLAASILLLASSAATLLYRLELISGEFVPRPVLRHSTT